MRASNRAKSSLFDIRLNIKLSSSVEKNMYIFSDEYIPIFLQDMFDFVVDLRAILFQFIERVLYGLVDRFVDLFAHFIDLILTAWLLKRRCQVKITSLSTSLVS